MKITDIPINYTAHKQYVFDVYSVCLRHQNQSKGFTILLLHITD